MSCGDEFVGKINFGLILWDILVVKIVPSVSHKTHDALSFSNIPLRIPTHYVSQYFPLLDFSELIVVCDNIHIVFSKIVP